MLYTHRYVSCFTIDEIRLMRRGVEREART